jgi:hypothetical protein
MTDPTLPILPASRVEQDGTRYALAQTADGNKLLLVSGDTSGFSGQPIGSNTLLCPRTHANAAALRERLPWLRTVPLGLRTSAGFGDRLGVATPGHVAAVRGTGVAPIFAQQSVRENTRTGRTPQGVMDDAMWGVFESGWREPWGADADHLKQTTDIPPFADAGYTFFTIDPGDHVDDAAESDDLATLWQKAERLDWATLGSSVEEQRALYLKPFEMDGLTLEFNEAALAKALAKYGGAVAHTVRMQQQLAASCAGRPFEMEMSVDETGTTTSLHEHFYIASELIRLDVPFISLAPRFVGRFEKGVDYIGDLGELEQNIAGHAAIMRHFGRRYKLSLHTGSDKFGVYPIAMKHTGGLVHLKTAGTSYLEALRVAASAEPVLFRRILDFSRERYETDRKTYHVSAELAKVPAADTLNDAELVRLLDQFDARQVLHVTFGSVLDTFGGDIQRLLRDNAATYADYLKRHFDRHLESLRQ